MNNKKERRHADPHPNAIDRRARQSLRGHGSVLVWFTGFSGSGKSTIAYAVERELHRMGAAAYVLDGDILRSGINRGLGFSRDDRRENVRRAAEAAKLLVDCGIIVLAALISPYQADRDAIRQSMQPGDFIEVYVRCPLDECERRDPKGLYARARSGSIPSFTGISDPYEPPAQPELTLESDRTSVSECAKQVVRCLAERGVLGLQTS